MAEVKIGNKYVGDGHPCFVIAEIGINHNGDVELAKRLIDVAAEAECDSVKFQKRTPEICVPAEQGRQMRETPWGYITYMEYRKKVEFGLAEYQEIDRYCKEKKILWFASCWDPESVAFISQFDVPCFKIASASLTDDGLLLATREAGRAVILSTGMSNLDQIDHAVSILGRKDLILLHACSVYPAYYEELNLRVMPILRKQFGVPTGYSGHETGLSTSVAAVAMGACAVERHITLDRSMWGSDHAASLEPSGISRLVRDIRLVETALGDGIKRVSDREKTMITRLRRVGRAT